jgi:ankyrin repeat protein
VKELIMSGAEVKFKDHEGNTSFLESCLMGHYDIVIYMLSLDDQKIDINYKNHHGRTALHKAAFGGNH